MDTNLLLIIMTVMVCVCLSCTCLTFNLHVVLDILNCMINDHNCTQICVEVEGSFNCSCYPGYELEDGFTCTGSLVIIKIIKLVEIYENCCLNSTSVCTYLLSMKYH